MRLINKHAFCGFCREALKGFFGGGSEVAVTGGYARGCPFNVAHIRNTNSKTVAAVDVVGLV